MISMTAKFEPNKILIVLHGSIGDVTRALPLAKLLKQGFPRAFLAWSVEPAAYPLLQGNPFIDEIILFDRRRWWKNFVPFLAEVRARSFDLVLDLQRHLKSGLISRLSGAPRRLGFHPADSKEGNGLFNNLHIARCGDTIAKIDHYLEFADYLGIPRGPIEWAFLLTADERAGVDRHLAHTSSAYAVLFVGSRWQSKHWFPQQMTDCANLLQSAHGLDVLLLGAAQDRDLAEQAMAGTGQGIVNLVGRTSLREALGLIQRAKLAIGPDTGLMHIAAAVGTPVVSLWGATEPLRTGPFGFDHLVIRGEAPCSPCHKRQCPIGRICMQSITSAMIGEKLALALNHNPKVSAHHG